MICALPGRHAELGCADDGRTEQIVGNTHRRTTRCRGRRCQPHRVPRHRVDRRAGLPRIVDRACCTDRDRVRARLPRLRAPVPATAGPSRVHARGTPRRRARRPWSRRSSHDRSPRAAPERSRGPDLAARRSADPEAVCRCPRPARARRCAAPTPAPHGRAAMARPTRGTARVGSPAAPTHARPSRHRSECR